jgi:hypothetical protein
MMLKLFLATAFLVSSLGTTVLAQSKVASKPRPRKTQPSAYPSYNYSPATTPEPSVVTPELPPTKYFYITGLYSSANAIKYKGSADLFGTPTSFTATESTTGSFGLAGGYMARESGRLGYSGELTYELPRTSSGVEGMVGNQRVHGTYDGAPSNSVLTLSANGNFSLSSHLYIYAGVNYPFANGNGGSMNGLPGFQLGGGYVFSRHISTELSYRVLRLRGTIESPELNLQIDEAAFSGILLAIQYIF